MPVTGDSLWSSDVYKRQPRSWLEGIYSYAANAMNPDKIMMGLPGYGWRWQIYDTTENLGTTYRGTSLTYYAAKYWMEGLYNHTGDAPPQPFIPFFSYWDWTDMVPWGLLQVYDFMEGWDTSREIAEPTKQETYSGRKYLTTYLKQQELSLIHISSQAVGEAGRQKGEEGMHQKDAGSIGFGGGEIMSLNSRIIKALEPMKLKVTVSEYPVNDEEGKDVYKRQDICSTKLNGGKANEGKNNSRKQKRRCESDGGNP